MMPAPSLLYVTLFAVLMQNAAPGQNELHHRSARKRPNTELFQSFAILDSKLSLLTTQQSALQASASSWGAPTVAKASLQSQATLLQNMNTTTTLIIGRVNHLENLYRRQDRKFGVRTFRIMGLRARRVRHELAAMKVARGEAAREAAAKRLGERITALVVLFQAVSGGHEVTHCRPREWICCEPKRTKDLMPGQDVGCSWRCSPKANHCAGLVGPRIPAIEATR